MELQVYKFGTYLTLSEMSLDDIRANMIDAISNAGNKDLVTMYRAMESSIEKRLVRNKLVALFNDRGLSSFINKPPFEEFLQKIITSKASSDQKVEFVDGLIAGKYFKPSSFIQSKSGKLKSLINTTNPVMSELLDWMFTWAPQIDTNSTVGVGSSEALLIFLSPGGKKADVGDVKIGRTLIEVKIGGGALGKDGPTYWGGSRDFFISDVKKIFPDFAAKSNADIAKMNPLSYTTQKEKSVALNTLSSLMQSIGKSDAEISAFWKSFIDRALGVSLSKNIDVARGVVDYNSWMRYATAAALEKYIKQSKFDILTLIDVKTGEYLNFNSGNDMLNSDEWHFDQSLTWAGGGQGKGLSPRIFMGAKKFPTYQSNDHIKALNKQYNDIMKVANAISRRAKNTDKLLNALHVDPNINHQIKVSGLLRNPEVRKIMMMKTKAEIEQYWKSVSK